MQNLPSLGIVFVALAGIFIGIALRDYLNAEGKMTIARKVWLRMAFIFICVGIGLYFLQIVLHSLTETRRHCKPESNFYKRSITIKPV